MGKIFSKPLYRRLCASLVLFFFLLSPVASWACTSIIVGKDASTTGKVLIARTADADPTLAVRFIIHEAGRFKANETKVLDPYGFSFTFTHDSYRYTAVPMSTEAYKGFIYGVRWGAPEPDPADVARFYPSFEQSGVNEKGLTVSATNTTGFRDEVLALDPIRSGSWAEQTMVTVLLAECATAQEALDVVERIVTGPHGIDNSLIMFADKDEAWIVEGIGGSRYVATRVPDDSFAVIANATVTDRVDLSDRTNYRGSADMQAFAEGANVSGDNFAIYHENGDLNVARTFGRKNSNINDVNGSYNSFRRWRGYSMFAPSLNLQPLVNANDEVYQLYVRPDQKISPTDIMNMQRDRYQGTPYDTSRAPQYLNPDGTEANPTYLDGVNELRPIGIYNPLYTHVFEAGWEQPDIGARFWLSMGAAEQGVNIPFYGNITTTHPYYQKDVLNSAENHYQTDNAYWLFSATGKMARSNREKYSEPLKAYWRAYELELYNDLPDVEAEMMRLYATNPAAAAEFITDYTLEVSEKTFKKAEMIHDALEAHIATRPGELFVIADDPEESGSSGGCDTGLGVFALLFVACAIAFGRKKTA
jgi:dipeptidase